MSLGINCINLSANNIYNVSHAQAVQPVHGADEIKDITKLQRTDIVVEPKEIDKRYGANNVLSLYKDPAIFTSDYIIAYRGIKINKI